ncbi:DedA family protein [Liquorilactobacillus mali]|uniref:Alkaline phosphatase n=1 Tax=Liquorilactobacillus mali KCTC 3596 = DSM 20444 TaxID=1046596 RepID=A0A0R2E7N2_9LACO|nr:DedA family protein [Liquorilactobacillus mali]KRN08727.1 alkaline phosphatase [Liquorilactobacillus mali KCTC 3596 = DSM 20444]MDC7953337.1 DedA family protein [Liquorilactobacillus mali]QFQ75461.1 DedA family protein [Liquorilactobacillus mali]
MSSSLLTQIINDYGYFGIALLLALENIFPPIPSEVILGFTGFMTLSSKLNIIGSIIAATIGALIGALVLYFFGKIISVERLERILAGRIGKILHFKPADLERAASFFNRHGNSAVFFGRFVPVVRSLISVPAGMADYPLGRFVIFSTLGALIWNTVLIFVGRMAGHAWPHVINLIESYGKISLIVLVVLFIIGYFIYKKRKR